MLETLKKTRKCRDSREANGKCYLTTKSSILLELLCDIS